MPDFNRSTSNMEELVQEELSWYNRD